MSRFRLAVAFTVACAKHRIRNRDRIKILQAAGGLEGLVDYLGKGREEGSFKESLLNQALMGEMKELEGKSFPVNWRALTFQEAHYPARLRHISHPPALLFVSGAGVPVLNRDFTVGIIGSRRPSPYGVEVTKALAARIAARGVPVISGGARGIDGLAHATALAAGGKTLAVIGSGLGINYPPEHRALFSRIEQEGALITEYVPGTVPRRNHFPARNRILAGLCDAVLVTEASASSGTLITAGFAADHGREVLAVPGSILSGHSRSCHQLIKDGAILIEAVEDIPGLPAGEAGSPALQAGAADKVSPAAWEDRLILATLDSAPRTLAGLVEACGLDRERVVLRMALLQKSGLIRQSRGLYSRSV